MSEIFEKNKDFVYKTVCKNLEHRRVNFYLEVDVTLSCEGIYLQINKWR